MQFSQDINILYDILDISSLQCHFKWNWPKLKHFSSLIWLKFFLFWVIPTSSIQRQNRIRISVLEKLPVILVLKQRGFSLSFIIFQTEFQARFCSLISLSQTHRIWCVTHTKKMSRTYSVSLRGEMIDNVKQMWPLLSRIQTSYGWVSSSHMVTQAAQGRQGIIES